MGRNKQHLLAGEAASAALVPAVKSNQVKCAAALIAGACGPRDALFTDCCRQSFVPYFFCIFFGAEGIWTGDISSYALGRMKLVG